MFPGLSSTLRLLQRRRTYDDELNDSLRSSQEEQVENEEEVRQ